MKKCLKRKFWLPVPLAVASLVLATTATGARHASSPFKIGIDVSVTGWTSSYDQPNVEGLKLAAADYNKKGGILGHKIELINAGDNVSKTDRSANFADNLIAKGVNVGVTSCDYDVGGPGSIEFQKKGILSFSVCASALLYGPTGGLPLGFSSGDSAAGYAAAAADFGYQKQHWRTAYILLDNTIAYTKEMCSSFDKRWQELGGKVVGRDTFSQSDQSIQGQISRILALKTPPDVIRLCTYLPGMASTIKQIRSAGITAPIIAGSEADGTFWHKGIPNLSNFYYTAKASIFGDDPNKKLDAFYSRLTKFEGKPPSDGIAVGGYMIIQALAIAAQRAHSLDGKALAAQLEQFHNVPLLLGPTSFSKKFHVSICRPPAIMEATAPGKVHFIGRYPLKTVPLPDSAGGKDYNCG